MTNQNQEELFTGLSDFSDLDVQKIPGMDESEGSQCRTVISGFR